ncbi:nucleoside hydrolase [Oceanobacillus polygoni]|uniref:Purine nucleosidase n=1 Tax=Oceanobacillus polygoni TaxID=1235259 RepID=A0A9X0YQJ7_9BACI|nr:nucleoside hydrolase [Oceanobacillus polygoni]MBP2076879.1 purine nucleosidase [Oceanobacillus polygoni]
MTRIIIDTDIGTNPDDAIAITLALQSPEITIEGITTVYGNVDIRSPIANHLLTLSGKEEIHVYPGISDTLLGNREIFWTGLEEQHITEMTMESTASQHAVDFIIQSIMNHPGEITLVPIGPLTNIAVAMIKEPQIINNVKEIIMMGGVTRLGTNGKHLAFMEHNVKSDPEAASIVFRSNAPITMIGLDVTRSIQLSRTDLIPLSTEKTLTQTLNKMIRSHMEYMNRDFSYLCDPLAIAAIIDRSLIETERMSIHVDYHPQYESGQTIGELNEKGNIQVALEVDNERFLNLFKSRITGLIKNERSKIHS